MHPAPAPRGDAHIVVDMDKIVGGSELLGRMPGLIRRTHASNRVEQACLDRAKGFVLFPYKLRLRGMGDAQIVAFRNHLAVDRKVAASGQNRVLNAPVFLSKRIAGGQASYAMRALVFVVRPASMPACNNARLGPFAWAKVSIFRYLYLYT